MLQPLALATILLFSTASALAVSPSKQPPVKKTPIEEVALPEHQEPSMAADLKKFELRTAPLAFLARWITAEGLFRFNSQWAAGPSYVQYVDRSIGNMFWPSLKGFSAGFVVTHYLKELPLQGIYATLRYHYEDFRYISHGQSNIELRFKGHNLLLVGGVRLPIGEHFFLMPGLGIQAGYYHRLELKSDFLTRNIVVKNDPSSTQVRPYLEAKAGVEF